MKLITQEIRNKLPPLYSNDETPAAQQKIIAKFFFPAGAATWYVTEGEEQEGGDFLCYGWATLDGSLGELGYFSINELESIEHLCLGVERDLHFPDDKTLGDMVPDLVRD